MTCGIYKIKNLLNGKLYIGQSVNIERRWKGHKYNSQYDYKKNHLYTAFKRYGIENFEFSIVVECDECVLDVFEIGIIELYNSTDRTKGYNNKLGGSTGKHTEETKQKLSEILKGRSHTKETKQKMSNSRKRENNNFFGKTHSEEAKQKMSESRKGKPAHNKGKPASDEAKQKMSEAKKGRKLSEETKQKVSNAFKKQYIYQGQVFLGKQELADFLGISYNTLRHRISKKTIDVTIINKTKMTDKSTLPIGFWYFMPHLSFKKLRSIFLFSYLVCFLSYLLLEFVILIINM